MKRLPTYSDAILDSHQLCCESLGVIRKLKGLHYSRRYLQAYIDHIIKFFEKENGFIATAERLKRFVHEIENNWYNNSPTVPKKYRGVNKKLTHIFNYDGFAKRKGQGKKGGGIPLMREILKQVRYCPYCNADMILFIKCDDNGKTYKSAFDHFYPRSRYPFLGLSLYNLIPSCDRCNSRFKGDKYKEVLGTFHPYIDDVDTETHFVLDGLTEDMKFANENSDGLKIKLEIKQGNRQRSKTLKNYLRLFKINDYYSQLYPDEALRILHLGDVINESYREEIEERFLKAGICVDPVKLLLGTPLERTEINKHHISKLKLDILEQYCNVKVEP